VSKVKIAYEQQTACALVKFSTIQYSGVVSEVCIILYFTGSSVNTEMHSALSAVMEDPDDPSTALNADLLVHLKLHDKVTTT
jgi:hypothetical protein